MNALGVECIQGSVGDWQTCIEASRGVAAIIHTAAMAGVWGSAQLYEQANVVPTRHLLEAADANQVRAFVYSSSPSVTFDGSPQRNVDESAPYPARWLCHYPRTKAIAEELVHKFDALGPMATCSLRPHLIWGDGDPHLRPRVIARCRAGRLRRVGSGTNLIDTVHVDQAAMAHRLAMEQLLIGNSDVRGHPFFVTDGAPIECWQWISMLLGTEGLQPPSKTISFPNAYRIGALCEWVYRCARIRSEPPMTRFVAAQLGVDHYFNITAAKQSLNYEPIPNRHELLSRESLAIGQSKFPSLK